MRTKFNLELLRPDYKRLWESCTVNLNRVDFIEAHCKKILSLRKRYDTVSVATGVPWYIIATIHSLEGSLSFRTHLHNGDPLTARTVQVPAGRPILGRPPFTWEASAIDALRYDGLTKWRDWSPEGALFILEKYNGFGYRQFHPTVLSPYLWSFTNHYTRGKYSHDGKFSPTLVSSQCGAAPILQYLTRLEALDGCVYS